MKKIRIFLLALAGVFVGRPLPSSAVIFTEDFSTDPAASGWHAFGNTNLFQWDVTNQNLRVTWDSSQTNSYFYHPLGTILARDDDFSLEFDLRLDDVTIGGYGFELGIGFLNVADATGTNFLRGTGSDSPNLVEFDYFPDAGFGPSIDATLTDQTRTNFHFLYDTQPLDPGVANHVIFTHAAGAATIVSQIFTNGSFYTSLPFSFFTPEFLDFRVDTISVESYSDAFSGGSIVAHGVVDNLIVTMPPPPVQNFAGTPTNGFWQGQFTSRNNWFYTLERTVDFQSWSDASSSIAGDGTMLMLQDSNPPAERAFYRVWAQRP